MILDAEGREVPIDDLPPRRPERLERVPPTSSRPMPTGVDFITGPNWELLDLILVCSGFLAGLVVGRIL